MARHQESAECQENPSFLFDILYCSEDNWELFEDVKDKYIEHNATSAAVAAATYYDDTNNYNSSLTTPTPPLILEQEMFWEEEELATLFAKEEQNHLYRILETNPLLAQARSEAVEWIFKVNAHYSFTPLTALLAINYLDRFLVTFHFQADKPWTTQLVAVACLSIAAKVEEIQVPLLLDFQVEDSEYVFEAKTIQRMEILVLSTLKWKMNPVTPISFLDHFTRRLRLKGYLCCEFLMRCERILLSVISDSRSMQYVPSVMATATMLHVINNVEPYLGTECQTQILGGLGIDKDKVEDCKNLIVELATRDYYQSQSTKRKFGSTPGSPNGVMDFSFSSDNSNDSWAVASSVSSSPEPTSKKSRSLHHETADFLIIPR